MCTIMMAGRVEIESVIVSGLQGYVGRLIVRGRRTQIANADSVATQDCNALGSSLF